MNKNKRSDNKASGSVRKEIKASVPEVSRRELFQTLGVLGAVKLAGCSDEDDTEEERSDDLSTDPDSDEEPELEMDANIAQLIENHDQELSDKSYTLDINLNGESTDPEARKQIEYLKETDQQRVVSLATESTVDDGVETFKHYFTPELQAIELSLEDGTSSASRIELPTSVLEITGGSIFDKFLLGASIAEPEDVTYEEIDETVQMYDVEFHRGMDLQRGEIAVDSDGIIRMFELEWLGEDDVSRWIELMTTDIGRTNVEIPTIES